MSDFLLGIVFGVLVYRLYGMFKTARIAKVTDDDATNDSWLYEDVITPPPAEELKEVKEITSVKSKKVHVVK